MARKKARRRPNAGPPPVRNARRDAREAAPARPSRAPARPARAAGGMPQPLPFRGVLLRAVMAAVMFYVYVLVVSDLGADGALPVAALAFVLMIPVGLLMDRAVYRIRLRRWQRRQGAA